MSEVRVLLADDHALVRAGVRAMLEAIEEVSVVGEASDGREAVALAREHRPDIAVLDISMRGLNGIDAGRQIKADRPETRVLILSMHASGEFVQRAMRSGVSGYLVKDSAPHELGSAIQALLRGETYLSPRVSSQLASAHDETAVDVRELSLEGLTARQREVLQLLAEGRSTRSTALLLDLSVKTVEAHRASLMDRLGIHDLAGLVIYAVRHKLVGIERRVDAL